MFGLLSRRRKQRQSGALSMKDRRFDTILSRLLAYASVPDVYDFNEIINYHFFRFLRSSMFRIRISECCRLRAGSSLRRAATVLSLLILCPIPRGHVFSQQSREKEREQRILQIQQLFGQGDLAGARKLLDETVVQFPADAGLDNLLGIIEAQEGNYAAAERSFNRAITRERKFTGAYLNLGRLYQEHAADDPQALPKALEVYRQALQYEPDNAEANYQSAALLMRKGAYQASLDHLSRLPARIQNSAQALSVSCADYAGLGRSDRANEMAGRLLAHPDFSEPDVSAILPALAGGRRDDLSVALLEGLRKRQPLSPSMARHLGMAYEQTGKLAEARATLETSVAGDRPSSALLVELARVAHKQQDYQGALGYLAHARDLEPNNASLSYFFGLVCLDLNLVAEARTAFDGAVKLEPENPAYNYAMGATSAFRHDPSEAIPYFEKYIRLKPQDARGKLALGAALFRAKRYDAAIKALTEAVKVPETATTAQYYLGSIARQEGRLDEAIQELQQALKANPDYTDALAELGQCYLMKKEYEPAGKLLRRALEINPNHYAANFNLLTLYARAKDGREAAQAARFEEVKKLREEKALEFLRMVEIHPYPIP
jgi:tetratricopeptide (TPR) repeat protein